MHQRPRDVDQSAASQHPIGQLEDLQTHGVGAGGLVIADKTFGLQGT
jgi:hypothetical protein